MIPVAQFDPATLSIWYDPEIVQQGPEPEATGAAIGAALSGEPLHAVAQLAALTAQDSMVRGVQLVSTVWHEQRHFLDVLLTNHGAFRFRQFAALYVNIQTVLALLRASDLPLVFPLSVYLDPVRRGLLGLGEAPEDVLSVASDIEGRKSMSATDREVLDTSIGHHEVGGDVQLEALGSLFQLSAVDYYFGRDIALASEVALPEVLRFNLHYRWLFILLARDGLITTEWTGEDTVVWRPTIAPPLLYASLASRHHGQTQSAVDGYSSEYPATRLAGLLTHLRRMEVDWTNLNGSDAWQLVNDACSALWDRSAIEEMQADLDHEERWCTQVAASPGPPDFVKALISDAHDLRSRLMTVLVNQPELIFETPSFSEVTLGRLRPAVIVARPAGVLGEPPAPYKRVMGYRELDDDRPEAKWWWAACWWHEANGATYVLKQRDAWLSAVDEFAPIAKLMMNGRRHRVVLGPEMIVAEGRLRAEGFEIKIDPLFAFPALSEDPRSYFFLSAKDAATCDFCKDPLAPDDARIISPWAFRSNLAAFEVGTKLFGGEEIGRLRMLRDWSVWLVHRRCQKVFGERVGLSLGPD